MVLVWLVVELVFVLFFFTLPTIDESPPPNLSASEVEVPHGSINKPHNSKDVNSASNETTPLLTHRSPPNIASSKSSSRKMNTDKRNIWYSSGLWRIWELMREETVVLLAVLFTTMFNQTAIEVSLQDKLSGRVVKFVIYDDTKMGFHELTKLLNFFRPCVCLWLKNSLDGGSKPLASSIA